MILSAKVFGEIRSFILETVEQITIKNTSKKQI